MIHPLIPAPAYLTLSAAPALRIATGTPIAAGHVELSDVIALFAEDVERDTGLRLIPDGGYDAPVRVDLVRRDALAGLPPTGGVRADGGDPDAERFGLEVHSTHVRVRAATAEGVHRGLTTLRQMLYANLGADGSAKLPTLSILDTPRYAWRGLSLDVARTFHDADQVLRVLDMLSLYKLNVLHLHLTDDQGWRIPVPGWPALTEVGRAYAEADLKRIAAHAERRFITVVPEVDMPGHTQAVFRSYAELAPADPGPAGPIPVGTLDPGRELTWLFVRDVLRELAESFPTSRYLHVGGDEAFGMADEAHAAFVDRAAAVTRALGRRVVGWQEIARSSVGPDEIVQYWIDAAETRQAVESGVLAQMLPEAMADMVQATLAKTERDLDLAAAKGTRVLLSPNSHLYLDRPYAEATDDPEIEARRSRLGLPVYPPKTVEQCYDWDPEAAVEGSGVQPTAIAGVEAAVWCETVTSGADLEFLLLPRLPGIAERAWSPGSLGHWAEYRGRLSVQSGAWRRRGWTWFPSPLVDWRP